DTRIFSPLLYRLSYLGNWSCEFTQCILHAGNAAHCSSAHSSQRSLIAVVQTVLKTDVLKALAFTKPGYLGWTVRAAY
ncbi:MAG: hypothetical protein KDI29_15020, partial [Pseudomonadales bacterium]|nr:hypothetical protein [Pseudomonadales bacterium]